MSDLVQRSPGWSLPQAAYTDADVFAADLDLKGARAIPEDAVLEVLVARLAALSGRARGGPIRRGSPRPERSRRR